MKKLLTLSLLTFSLLFTACTSSSTPAIAEQESEQQEEITITHPLGETTLTTNPEKVVVLDYGLLDSLDYAGVDSIVGVPQSSAIPNHLSKYTDASYENAGSLKEADFEKINEIAPDLILITSRLTESYEELSKIAPTVFLTMPGATYMETFLDNVNILASIFTDQKDNFLNEATSITSRTEKIAEAAKGSSALLIQASDGQFNVFGFGSRYAVVYEDFGFTLTDESIAVSIHGQSASFEYLVEQNPDYLFVIDRSAAIGQGTTGAQALLENDLTAGMNAVKNNHVTYLDSTNWYTVAGGIQATIAMLEELEGALGL